MGGSATVIWTSEFREVERDYGAGHCGPGLVDWWIHSGLVTKSMTSETTKIESGLTFNGELVTGPLQEAMSRMLSGLEKNSNVIQLITR